MSVLRVYCRISDAPVQCAWLLTGRTREAMAGEGPLSTMPRGADRVEMIVPASDVLITRAHLPPATRRRTAAVLSYAVEEETLPDPAQNYVCRLGAVGAAEVLAVLDIQALARWTEALAAVGIAADEVHCETLLLPWRAGEWSLAWNGAEGILRTGQLEGAATDCGCAQSPPLSVRLALDGADERPECIAVYVMQPGAEPDVDSWAEALGIPVLLVGSWDWRSAPVDGSVSLVQPRSRWSGMGASLRELRPAAWIAAAALAIHALALLVHWTVLANEQRELNRRIETTFRAAFPDATAVVDPVLQMRRKLADIRHAAGKTDDGDFLPMLEKAAAAIKDLPTASVRATSYGAGQLRLEIAADDATMRRVLGRLRQTGMSVEAAARGGTGTAIVTLRAS
jgi:general secretion pathway protein L